MSSRLSLLAVSALVATGCVAPGEPAAPASSAAPRLDNVIVILVDTLRASNLGAYGHDRPTSPSFDELATTSVLFEQARAQAPCTFPSANTILTGRAAPHFMGQPEGRMGIPPGIPSLAETLGEVGYATVAVSASPIVRETPSQFNEHGGFARGFDLFEERCQWNHAACVNTRAVAHLEVLREPFFLYLHYMDPHGPFNPPPRWERRWATSANGVRDWVAKGDPNPLADMIYNGTGEHDLTVEELTHLQDLYDDEIGYFDQQLGELLDELRARGLLDRSQIWIVADHGEEFLEHGHVKHCHTLYDTELHTPMLLRLPGGGPGRRIPEVVANVDLVPTVLDYLGLEPDPERYDGRSLRPLVERGEPRGGPVFSAWGAERSVTDGRFKLVFDLRARSSRLYDVLTDPGETVDVAGDHPQEVRRLKRQLSKWIREVERSSEGSAAERGEEAEERLRALGYIE